MGQRVTMSEREGLIELHYLFEVFKLNSILSRCNIMDYKIKTTFFAHVIVLCTEHQVYAIRVLRTSCLCTIVFACDSVTVWVVPFWLALRQSCHMPSVAKQKKKKREQKTKQPPFVHYLHLVANACKERSSRETKNSSYAISSKI